MEGVRSRYQNIPIARREVLRALVEHADATSKGDGPSAHLMDARRFTELAALLQAIYHFEFHARLEAMKDDYSPFNPDLEGIVANDRDRESIERGAVRLGDAVERVLERGNYQMLNQAEILRAFNERSLFPVDLRVNIDFFDAFVVYARGESLRQETIVTWFGLWKRTFEVPAYDRVCLYIRCKSDAALPGKLRKRLGMTYQPGMILIKLFRNIPKNDLEMLFPSYEVRMRMIDKLLLGVPAIAAGVPVLSKLGPALLAMGVIVGLAEGRLSSASLITGLTGLTMLSAYLFTQWTRFQFQKVLFMKVLSENLYFRNLDNNEGVLTRLVDDAEEEECKEALLAYYFLILHGGTMHGEELDRTVEAWFQERFALDIDFDVDDALRKLEELGLGIVTEEEGVWQALPINQALELVNNRWDAIFEFKPPAAAEA